MLIVDFRDGDVGDRDFAVAIEVGDGGEGCRRVDGEFGDRDIGGVYNRLINVLPGAADQISEVEDIICQQVGVRVGEQGDSQPLVLNGVVGPDQRNLR